MFKMRQLLLDKKKKELSEYKAIYMIKDYYQLFYEGLQKGTQELSKIFLRFFAFWRKMDENPIRMRRKQSLIS